MVLRALTSRYYATGFLIVTITATNRKKRATKKEQLHAEIALGE